jgi:V8-like Glu-specific endopeptidase
MLLLLLITLLASCCRGKLADEAAQLPADTSSGISVSVADDTDDIAYSRAMPSAAAAVAVAAPTTPDSHEQVVVHHTTKPNSEVQAMRLLHRIRHARAAYIRTAVNLSSINMGDSAILPAAICGNNSLTASNYTNSCLLSVHWRTESGMLTTGSICTGFILSNNTLGTAGHCVYDRDGVANGWAATIDVFCKGFDACAAQRDAYAVRMVTTPAHMRNPAPGNAYDMAVMKLNRDLTGVTPYRVGMYTSAFSKTLRPITLSGYPKSPRPSKDWDSCAFVGYKGCKQYSSSGSLHLQRLSLIDGYGSFWYTDGVDLCPGHSGSGILDTTDGFIVGELFCNISVLAFLLSVSKLQANQLILTMLSSACKFVFAC